MNAIDNFIEMVEAIQNEPSTNAKKNILKEYVGNNFRLVELLKMIYDLRRQYFFKRKSQTFWENDHKQWEKDVIFDYKTAFEKDDEIRLITQILQYMIDNRGNYASMAYYDVNLKARDNFIMSLNLILNRTLNCGVSVKIINSVLKELGAERIFEFNVMLAEKFDLKHLNKKDNFYWQEKMDGVRVEAFYIDGNIELYTRNGLIIDLPSKQRLISLCQILELQNSGYFSRGVILCLEICGNDRQSVSGLINSVLKGKTLSDKQLSLIDYHIFEVVSVSDFYETDKVKKFDFETRYEYLSQAFKECGELTGVHLVKATKLQKNGLNEYIQEAYNDTIAQGKEGIVVKNASGIYEPKRTNNWLKMKEFKTADLICKEVIPGNGKYEGKIGSLRLTDASGTLDVCVGSGMSDDFRSMNDSSSLLDKIVEVRYNSTIKEKGGKLSLFLPIFVSVRDDKRDADTIKGVI